MYFSLVSICRLLVSYHFSLPTPLRIPSASRLRFICRKLAPSIYSA
nr:MAG TPA: hypothetical protein [Caudoviricetes sp.]